MNNKEKLLILWLAPFLLGPIYAIVRYVLHSILPRTVQAPTSREIYSVVILELLSSPFWVGVGYVFTYFFGSIVLVYLIRALAKNKILKPKFVISAKDKKPIEDILAKAEEEEGEDEKKRKKKKASQLFSRVTKKNFGLSLALTLSINLVYTLTIQRYFQNIVVIPSGTSASLYHYLLSPKLILSDYGLALLFLPLLAMVVPLFFGRVSVRQIDASRFDLYWLSYVYSIAGGASLVLFLVDAFESKGTTATFIFAIITVYALLSWYTAIGINIALPYAERRLAQEFLKLQENKKRKSKDENIIFGYIFAGPSKEEAQTV